MQFYNLFCPANVVYKATVCIVREKQVKRVVFMILLGFCQDFVMKPSTVDMLR